MDAVTAGHATTGEGKVARKLIKVCLDAGYKLSVNDGEEWTVKQSTDAHKVLNALASTGEDTLRLRDGEGKNVGFFFLVWGNAEDGEELIADHADTPTINALYRLVHPED